MKSIDDIERLEKVIGQLKAFHNEVGQLAKKSPNDALNAFKLRLVNNTLELANGVFGKDNLPFPDFLVFDEDAVPSNSDATVMLAQYLEEAERYRSRHVRWNPSTGNYVYEVKGAPTDIKAAPPSWSKK